MTEPVPPAALLAPDATLDTDIVVIGAGPVGMAFALALADTPWRIVLLDRQPSGAWAGDPRALALSHGTRQLLGRLGAWPAQADTPIHTIHVSQQGGFGRTLIDTADLALPALGHVMRYRDLAAALAAAIAQRQPKPQWLHGCETLAVEVSAGPAGPAGPGGARVTARRGAETLRIAAHLVVHAEGAPAAGAEAHVFDYRQHAVLAEVRPQPGHGHRAWERFTPDGPLALLPLGEDYSVVFTVPAERSAALCALDDAAFLAALRARFGRRLDFSACGPRSAWPLALRLRRTRVAPREVWIGNAAQTLHPVSGQGFNLGLRDAWELAGCLAAQPPGSDPGEAAPLAAWARARNADRLGSAAFTDGIVRLFSNDLAPLRVARGLGLLALDLAPPLRHFVARRMIWGARAWP